MAAIEHEPDIPIKENDEPLPVSTIDLTPYWIDPAILEPDRITYRVSMFIEREPAHYKTIDNPTTERLLKTFDKITLTTVRLSDRVIQYVTPLTTLQTRILELLGLSPAVYTQLAEN